jgi:hypothetical protein
MLLKIDNIFPLMFIRVLPKITWTNNLIRMLLAEIELSENRVVLLGKWKKHEAC